MSAEATPLGRDLSSLVRRHESAPPDSDVPAAPTRRVLRSLLGWTATEPTPAGRHVRCDPLVPLVRTHRAVHPRGDVEALRRAYGIAASAHSGQRRKSGEAYITHPLAVAEICAGLGMDTTALVAALLHDTVEDTDYTLDRLRGDFGDQVAHLVDGVTKLEKVRFGSAAEAETIRKMILAAGRDPRVLVIKLADRLHNMRTLGFKARASQERIARTTRDVLIPLAGRLGIHVLKRELEDLVFAILHPEAYERTRREVDATEGERARSLSGVVAATVRDLRGEKIKARVSPRARHLRSVYDQIQKPGRRLADDARIQIVIHGEPTDCYAALGVVHGRWQPVPGRFKDHIGVPKFNMYQSLHTTVIGPDARPLDVMIRTEGMHRVAEYGIAALQRYGSAPGDDRFELDWLQRVLDWQEETAEPERFLESLRHDLSDHDVLVFTPDGDSVSLPAHATPVDFAYARSTRLGDRCFGVKVNGQLAPLSSPLADGDVVEVLTSPSEHRGPSEEWLDFAKSPRAQNGIRRWFVEEPPQEPVDAIDAGRRAVVEALAARDRVLASDLPLVVLARELGLADVDALWAAVTEGKACPKTLADRLIFIVDGPSRP